MVIAWFIVNVEPRVIVVEAGMTHSVAVEIMQARSSVSVVTVVATAKDVPREGDPFLKEQRRVRDAWDVA